MITREIAVKKAQEYIVQEGEGIDMAIMPESTLEFEFGWVFFYQSKEFIETGNLNCIVFGNAPFIVDIDTGIVVTTGTRLPFEYYIQLYRQYRHDLKGFHDACNSFVP